MPQLQTDTYLQQCNLGCFVPGNNLFFPPFLHYFNNSEKTGCGTLLQKMLHRLKSLAPPNVAYIVGLEVAV